MYNVLTEGLIHMDTSGGARVKTSLVETLAALMRDEVDSFPALRPHQRHAWHAFLVQLGAMAMGRAGVSQPPKDAHQWLGLIRGLTAGYPDDEPWQMVVDDITKPAFMQPPASSKDRQSDYKNRVETPDELDMLVTSKNHDLKSSVASSAQANDWLFALISLQTSEGFSGAGNYGISRMNGGLGGRPAFSITPSTRPGGHARRDIVALLNSYPVDEGGIGLLWTQPWDGGKAESLSFTALDRPLYIEICRRVRLRAAPTGRLYAVRATSKASRIEAKALKGNTGDPWTPIDRREEGKSLTLAAGGFTYKRTVEYLTPGNWIQPSLLCATEAEQRSSKPMTLVARATVRGKGKTEGYHERIIPFRPKTKRIFGNPQEMDDLGDIAKERIKDIGTVQGILRHAVSVFAAGGKTESISDDHRSRANPWANRLDEPVDAGFFEDLQNEFEADGADEREKIRNAWLRGVIDSARELLRQAEDSLPCPAIQHYRARVRAESVFNGRLRGNKGLPHLFDQPEVTSDDEND